MSIGSISGADLGSALSASGLSIADNFDTFLGILTTQLKNQNPLEPMNAEQFTQQLVQFTGVEQQLKTNEFLEALLTSNRLGSVTQSAAFIGKEITASTNEAVLNDGSASWDFAVGEEAYSANFIVRNANGQQVYAAQRAISPGLGRFTWNGVTDSGETMTSGRYTIEVQAVNAAGQSIQATTEMVGVVNGVDFTGDQPYLLIGDSKIALDTVTSVKTPTDA